MKDAEEGALYEAYMTFKFIPLLGVAVSFTILFIGVISLIASFTVVYVILLLLVPIAIKLYKVVKFVTSWVKTNIFSKLSFLQVTGVKQYFLNIRIN